MNWDVAAVGSTLTLALVAAVTIPRDPSPRPPVRVVPAQPAKLDAVGARLRFVARAWQEAAATSAGNHHWFGLEGPWGVASEMRSYAARRWADASTGTWAPLDVGARLEEAMRRRPR